MDQSNTLNTRKIIHQARLNTAGCHISMAELIVIASAEHLSEGEKFLWLHLAAKTSFDSTLTCTLEPKEVTHLANILPQGIYYALARLQKLQYLKIHHEETLGTFYELSLPQTELDTLVDAPKVKSCLCEASFYASKKNKT